MLTGLKLPVALFFILTNLILQFYHCIYQKLMECNNIFLWKKIIFFFFILANCQFHWPWMMYGGAWWITVPSLLLPYGMWFCSPPLHNFLYKLSSVPTISLPNEELKNISIIACDIDSTNETFFFSFFFLNEIMLKIIVVFILESHY